MDLTKLSKVSDSVQSDNLQEYVSKIINMIEDFDYNKTLPEEGIKIEKVEAHDDMIEIVLDSNKRPKLGSNAWQDFELDMWSQFKLKYLKKKDQNDGTHVFFKKG